MAIYRLEVAKTARSICNGKKPCNGTKIDKGGLRLGTWVEIPNRGGSFKWRHWGCVTNLQLEHLRTDFNEASDIDGYEEIPEMYQEKVKQAWDDGHVADEDIPETARVPPKGSDEEESPKKGKKGGKKAKAEPDADDEPKKAKKSAAAKPKPKAQAKKSKKAKEESVSESEAESEEEAEESALSSEEDVKPKSKGKKVVPKRKAANGKKIKDESDSDASSLSSEDVKPKTKKARASKGKAASDDEDVKPKKRAPRASNGSAKSKRKSAVKAESDEASD